MPNVSSSGFSYEILYYLEFSIMWSEALCHFSASCAFRIGVTSRDRQQLVNNPPEYPGFQLVEKDCIALKRGVYRQPNFLTP